MAKKSAFLGLLWVAFSGGGVSAGESSGQSEIITNRKITLMLQEKIDEEIILGKIDAAEKDKALEISTNVEDIVEFKKAGATKKLLARLLAAVKTVQESIAMDVQTLMNHFENKDQERILQGKRKVLAHGPQAVRPLVEFLGKDSARAREGACQVLGEIGDGAALKHLIHVLYDSEPVVRRAAAEACAMLDEEGQLYPLILKKLRQGPKRVDGLLLALGYAKEKRAVPLLQDYLRTHESEEARACAAFALGHLGLPQAEIVSALQQTLTADPRSITRMAAGRALLKLGHLESVPAIIKIFKRDKENHEQKMECLEMLKSLRYQEVVDFIIEFGLDEEEPEVVRKLALHILYQLTGLKFDGQADWRTWWQRNKVRYHLLPKPREETATTTPEGQ